MALQLPPPTNDREQRADDFLALLSRLVDLSPGTSLDLIMTVVIRLIAQQQPTPDTLRCAGVRLVQGLPVGGVTQQYTVLTIFTCTPPDLVSANTIFLAPRYVGVLNSMQIAARRNPDPTLGLFKSRMTKILFPIVNDLNIPNPPLIATDISTIRAAYAGLIIFLFSP